MDKCLRRERRRSSSPHIIRLRMERLRGCFQYAIGVGRDILWQTMETATLADTAALQNIRPVQIEEVLRKIIPQTELAALKGEIALYPLRRREGQLLGALLGR